MDHRAEVSEFLRTRRDRITREQADLIGELVTRSDAFRQRWSVHDVRHHRGEVKSLHHPVVGDLELSYEAMDLPANPEWFMFAYTAEPGTPSEERLRLLGSLAVTEQSAEAASDDGTARR